MVCVMEGKWPYNCCFVECCFQDEVWKAKKFNVIFPRLCHALYNQNIIRKWTKDYILFFPKKGDLGITKKYKDLISFGFMAYQPS